MALVTNNYRRMDLEAIRNHAKKEIDRSLDGQVRLGAKAVVKMVDALLLSARAFTSISKSDCCGNCGNCPPCGAGVHVPIGEAVEAIQGLRKLGIPMPGEEHEENEE